MGEILNMNILHGIPPKLTPKDYCSIDSEWFNLNQYTIHRPTSGQFACMTSCYDGENVYIADTEQMALDTLKQVREAVWLIHEAKFDLTHLSRFMPWEIIKHDKLVDTLLMDKILWSGYYDRFGLAHLARRYLNIYLEKELQKSFQGNEMSQEQVEYACRDAMILRKIWEVQKTYIKKDDMYIWRNVDLPMLWAVMNFIGFRLDADRWKALAIENREKQKQIDSELSFNPRSSTQVVSFLKSKGFKNLPDSREDTLKTFIKKYPDADAVEYAVQILEDRSYGKQASTYGEKWIEKYLETSWIKNGNMLDPIYTVFPNWNIIGAETGRMSCSDPALQTIPTRDTKVYRECFIPRPGNVLLDADWSQQEIGIEAFLSDDQTMISIFNSGKDIYIAVAKELFGKIIEKSDPMRARMKTVVLGLDYGLSEKGLARKEGITEEEARELIKLFVKKFPRIAEYQREQSRETTQTKTVLGRRCYLNPYTYQCGNNALNNPVQGCLPRDAKVLTLKGWTEIKDIPDECILWDGENWASAEKLYRGEAKRLRLHLSDGRTFDCDDRHYLLTYDNVWPTWTSMQDIVGKTLVRDQCTNWGQSIYEIDDWYWAGRYIGDGYSSHSSKYPNWGMSFGSTEMSDVGRFTAWLDKNRHRFIGKTNSKKGYYIDHDPKGNIKIIGGTKSGCQVWNSLGIDPSWKSYTKRVPFIVFTLDYDRRKAFYDGYFDADGHRRKDKHSVTKLISCNKPLLQDMLKVMQTIGLTGKISKQYTNKSGASWYEINVHVTPLKLFVEKIETLTSEPMFTFSVESERHAFSSEGLISKNTAADMMKVAVGQMYKNWDFPIPFCGVAVVHDEFVIDCPKEYAPDVAKHMQFYMQDMANWMLPGMSFRAEVKVCEHSWAEKA